MSLDKFLRAVGAFQDASTHSDAAWERGDTVAHEGWGTVTNRARDRAWKIYNQLSPSEHEILEGLNLDLESMK